MTIKELKEKLSEFPDDYELFIPVTIDLYGLIKITELKQLEIGKNIGNYFTSKDDLAFETLKSDCILLSP